MKLLGMHTDDKHFIITTDKGERKVMLTCHGLPKIKAKCVELLGKNIKTLTRGDYNEDGTIFVKTYWADEELVRREFINIQ